MKNLLEMKKKKKASNLKKSNTIIALGGVRFYKQKYQRCKKKGSFQFGWLNVEMIYKRTKLNKKRSLLKIYLMKN